MPQFEVISRNNNGIPAIWQAVLREAPLLLSGHGGPVSLIAPQQGDRVRSYGPWGETIEGVIMWDPTEEDNEVPYLYASPIMVGTVELDSSRGYWVVSSWMDPTAMQIGPSLGIHTPAEVQDVLSQIDLTKPDMTANLKTAVEPLPGIKRISAWDRLGDLDI